MRPVAPRLAAALAQQHARRQALLRDGARRVGWKLGVGERESIGGEMAVGYLTSATTLESGATYVPSASDANLHADAEIVVELGRDVAPGAAATDVAAAIARYGVALELVDLSPRAGEPDSVVEANVFHRAVTFGPLARDLPAGNLVASLTVDGQVRASGAAPPDLYAKLAAGLRLLAAVAERLQQGDRVITGAVVQVPVRPADEVVAAVAGLGEARLTVSG